MPNVSKTSNFLKAINKYAAEQRKQIKTQSEEFRRYELNKAEAEVLRDAYYLIQREMMQMKKGISGEVSKMEMEKRKELFAKRNKIVNAVFEKAANKLIEFTKTPEYSEFLKKSLGLISKVLKKSGTVLYICERDELLSEEIHTAFGKLCKITVDKSIKIGGVRAENRTMAMIIDETLDAKLEEQKDWFEENSKLNVF